MFGPVIRLYGNLAAICNVVFGWLGLGSHGTHTDLIMHVDSHPPDFHVRDLKREDKSSGYLPRKETFFDCGYVGYVNMKSYSFKDVIGNKRLSVCFHDYTRMFQEYENFRDSCLSFFEKFVSLDRLVDRDKREFLSSCWYFGRLWKCVAQKNFAMKRLDSDWVERRDRLLKRVSHSYPMYPFFNHGDDRPFFLPNFVEEVINRVIPNEKDRFPALYSPKKITLPIKRNTLDLNREGRILIHDFLEEIQCTTCPLCDMTTVYVPMALDDMSLFKLLWQLVSPGILLSNTAAKV